MFKVFEIKHNNSLIFQICAVNKTFVFTKFCIFTVFYNIKQNDCYFWQSFCLFSAIQFALLIKILFINYFPISRFI